MTKKKLSMRMCQIVAALTVKVLALIKTRKLDQIHKFHKTKKANQIQMSKTFIICSKSLDKLMDMMLR